MAFGLPIIEQIAAALKTVLDGITEANGYTYTLAPVRPSRIERPKPAHLMASLWQEDPEREDDGFRDDMWKCVFPIGICFRQSDNDEAAIDTALNQIRSEVEKALCVDRTLGGLADSLYILEPEKWVEEEGFAGVTVSPEVHYHHAVGDPFTAA